MLGIEPPIRKVKQYKKKKCICGAVIKSVQRNIMVHENSKRHKQYMMKKKFRSL